MTEAPERIWVLHAGGSYWEGCPEKAERNLGEVEYIRADAARKVRPLVWEMQRPDATLWATDLETSYIVIHTGLVWRAKKRALVLGDFGTPDEAKAAAQADYAKRILAALEEG